MMKFKKDKNFLLLQSVLKLINSNMEYSKMNLELEEEISELMTDLTDKRNARKLKKLKNEFEKFVDDYTDKLKLEKKESTFLKEEHEKNMAQIASRDNDWSK